MVAQKGLVDAAQRLHNRLRKKNLDEAYEIFYMAPRRTAPRPAGQGQALHEFFRSDIPHPNR